MGKVKKTVKKNLLVLYQILFAICLAGLPVTSLSREFPVFVPLILFFILMFLMCIQFLMMKKEREKEKKMRTEEKEENE